MGNHQTNLNIDPYFEGDIIPTDENILVCMKLPKFTRWIILAKNKCSIRIEKPVDKNYKEYDWTPHSHMRDFEVLNPFEKNEKKIARGQGIGVIIAKPYKFILHFGMMISSVQK